jgi:hypothetical protein
VEGAVLASYALLSGHSCQRNPGFDLASTRIGQVVFSIDFSLDHRPHVFPYLKEIVFEGRFASCVASGVDLSERTAMIDKRTQSAKNRPDLAFFVDGRTNLPLF